MIQITPGIKEKIILLAIGTFVSTFLGLVVFLLLAYVGSFVTFADYNRDKIANVEIITETRNALKHIDESLKEVKTEIKEINKELKKR
jgi:hypothetical protein